MKSTITANLLIAAMAIFANGPAAAQTFQSHPINITGGSNILVTGINDSGTMVVNFNDATGMAHCVSIAGSTVTKIVDPNEVGTGSGKGTSCWGINNSGEIAGSYSAAAFGNGFTYTSGVYTDVIVPGATAGTTSYGLDSAGDVVGSFADNVGQHGFLYTFATNTFATLDVPGATATLALGINDSNVITLEWVNATFVFSAAILKNHHYTILNVPGMTQSKARGINVHGWINFDAQDATGAWHGFLYKNGTFTQYDVANATNTYGFGINSSGVLVGGYNPTSAPTTQIGFQGHIH